MEYDGYVAHVGEDSRRLIEVATGHLVEPVPSCPGWAVDDLVRHVALVYEHKIECTRLGVEPDPWPPAWPADREPIGWLADARTRLLAMFAAHGPADPSATWWPADQTVGFWARRMAHETAIHRVDAELALGDVTSIDDDLALDGIDEILRVMLEGDWAEAPSPASIGQRVAVGSATRRWIVTLAPTTIDVTEDDADATAAVRGSASDVVRWLWGRADDAAVSIDGDPTAVALLRSRLALATQ